MNLIIDANVFKGYYQEKYSGINHELTESPIYIFEDDAFTIFIDISDHIKKEYQNLINNQLVEEMLIQMMNKGKIHLSEAVLDPDFEKSLRGKGFNIGSKDIWYIRTAMKAKESSNDKSIHIVTEDIDFYNPKKKNCSSKERARIIRDKNEPIAKELIKKKKIKPICVCNHRDNMY